MYSKVLPHPSQEHKMAAAWHAGLSPDLVAASTSTLAVVEHCCATLPGGFHGYVPSAPVPKLLSDGHPWSVVTEDSGVKVRQKDTDGISKRASQVGQTSC
jgi:hypothetical protein